MEKIIEFLKLNEYITNADVQKILGVSSATATRILSGYAKEGRINPLQIVTALDDEADDGQNVSLSTHLQFLESFFKMILDGITNDALEILNECIKELYKKLLELE